MSSAAERHRAADRGRGAVGAGQSWPQSPGRSRSRGAAVSGGARTPLGGDESRRASSTGANPGGGGGSATPSPRGRTGPGRAPPDGYRGGGRGWGEPREAPGGWARAPEGGRSLKGGGGCSLPGGRRGPLLSEGGGGRVSPGVGPCRFMAARHGTISPTLRAGVPFFRGG